ncbi:hypothetical protein [Elioraea rosea]|uniref:hypothetical protein n=1 Tax=Elioraea rosea TaxID=2492390 RepID=UPI0011863DDB|nr:hypothetical protein [Elioraea rosea]
MRAARRCHAVLASRPLTALVVVAAVSYAAPALANDAVRARFPAPSTWELTIGPTLRTRAPDPIPRPVEQPASTRSATLLPDVDITPVLPGTTAPTQGRAWRAPGEAIEEPKHQIFGAKLKLPF